MNTALLPLALLFAARAVAVADPPPPSVTTTAATPTSSDGQVTAPPAFVDEGELTAATTALLRLAPDAARVAVIVVDDTDVVRRRSLERSLVRVLRERRREDIVSPAIVQARLGEAQRPRLEQPGAAATALGADHVLIAEVQIGADSSTVALRLVRSDSAAVVGTAHAALLGSGGSVSTTLQSVRTACLDVAEAIAEVLEQGGIEARLLRLAVAPVKAEGAAKEGKVDRLVQSELASALAERGFLVVERARLQTAMDQLALQQMSDEQGAAVGKIVGAGSIVLTSVAEANTAFLLDVRIVDVETGRVQGATRAELAREEVVAMADVEVKTPSEALFRSVLAPGWGQAYNGSPTKSVFFGVGTYGALATTVGLGVGAGLSYGAYLGVSADGTTAEEAAAEAVALREQTNVLVTATIGAAALTALAWGLNVGDAFIDALD